MPARIFISYAREDKEHADQLYLRLRSSGLDPWMDKPPHPFHLFGIRPGERWEVRIREEIQVAEFIITLFTPSSVAKRGFVQREFRMALEILETIPENRVFLIPIVIGDCSPPNLRVGTSSLSEIQYYDLTTDGYPPLVQFLMQASGYEPPLTHAEAHPWLTYDVARDVFRAPPIKWSVRVGSQQWKNRPVFKDGVIYVGSAGQVWNSPDALDGVYAIDSSSGNIRWFSPTNSDANEVLVTEDFVFCGTDIGGLWCIDRANGEAIWHREFHSGIAHRPVLTSDGHIFIVSFHGEASIIDSSSGRVLAQNRLEGTFISNLAVDPAGGTILVPSVEGMIFSVSAERANIAIAARHAVKCMGFDEREETPSLYAPPVLFEGTWIQPVVRSTYCRGPALVALDLSTSSANVLWHGSDPGSLCGHFGNIRSTPALIEDTLVFGGAYSQLLIGVNAKSGTTSWATELGVPMFPQWPAPVATSSSIYLPRHDGYVYEIDRRDHTKQWSLFLGKEQFAGIQEQIIDRDPLGNATSPFSESGNWNPLFGSPIFSTPCLQPDEGALFVGTSEGILYCVDLEGERTPYVRGV
jgi:outer membrane protein assembly factor BamB